MNTEHRHRILLSGMWNVLCSTLATGIIFILEWKRNNLSEFRTVELKLEEEEEEEQTQIVNHRISFIE